MKISFIYILKIVFTYNKNMISNIMDNMIINSNIILKNKLKSY